MKQRILLVCLSMLLPFLCVQLRAQNFTVKGKVIDETNSGLPGVTIMIKGLQQGTTTNVDGSYELSVPGPDAVLIFSFMGYNTETIAVKGRNTVNVTMKEDSKQLDEVVVVGYGSMKKSDVTGAMTSVRPNADEAGRFTSVDNLLQGKVAGLSVTQGVSSPGAASSVQIRGASSLRGDNQPLYVIDNIPQASTGEFAEGTFNGEFQIAQDPLTSLNPQDIESIEILKDASATAIYGSRGANGVIIITTKRGKAGKPVVSVNANFTLATTSKKMDMMGLRDYARYKNEGFGEQDQRYFFEGDEVRYIFAGGKYDQNDPDSYHVLNEKNWQDEIFRTAFSQNYGVTINGGSDNVKYFVSGGFKRVEGIVKKTSLRQGDLRVNLNTELAKSLKVNFSLSGSLKENNMMSGGDTKGGVTGSIMRTALDAAPYEIPDDDPSLSSEEVKTTVLSWLNDYDDITKEKTFKASMELNWNIWKGISYSLRTGGNIMIQDRKRWFGLELWRGQNDNGSLGITKLNNNNYTVENLLMYKKSFGKILDLDAMFGVTYDDYNSLNEITNGTQFDNHSLRTNGLHMAGLVEIAQPLQKDYQLFAVLARVNLSFLEGRYLATVNFRRDGSSKFREGKRYANYPSFSLAWRAEQEQFLKEISWISQLKIRAGYGETGNQAIPPYSGIANYGTVIDYANATGDKVLALGVEKLANTGLVWEKTSSYNLGLDFGFFNSRLTGSIDVYQKETKDLLIERNLPTSTGFDSFYMNHGGLKNRGVEISLSADIIRKGDWTWNVSGNIAFNKTKIQSLGLPESQFGTETYKAYLGNTLGDMFGIANIFIAGKQPGLFWGYQTDGIVQEGEEFATGDYSKKAGDVKFVDRNKNGVIDEGDKTVIGNPNPKFVYGFQTSVAYKGLSFSAHFNGKYGNDIFNSNIYYYGLPRNGGPNMLKKVYDQAWRPTAPQGRYPSVNATQVKTSMDRYIEDGSYLRCSDMTLAYTIPSRLTKKIGLDRVNVSVTGQNLFVITHYSGFDPEVSSFAFDGLRPGIDMNAFPNVRSVVFGLNVTF